MSIASGAGIECLTTEAVGDKALLHESSEITFSDKDMKVGYSDHRRPLYLAVFINQIPIKRALVDTGTYSTKHSSSSRNYGKEDSGMPNGSDRIRRER